MCVILVCEKKKPNLETLLKCELANKDGAGIAWRAKDNMEYIKGLDAKEVYKISQSKPLPQVIHFRLATVGKGELLCHPFPISKKVELAKAGQAKRLLFHNGHWSEWKKYCTQTTINHGIKAPSGKWSDSRAMAWLASIYGESFLEFLDEKIVVFSPKSINIYKDDGWAERDGIIFSNLYWEGRRYEVYPKSMGYDNPWIV